MSTIMVSIAATTRANVTTDLPLGSYTGNPGIEYKRVLLSPEATLLYAGQRTVTTSETLNLLSGLTDSMGVPLVFSNLLGWQIINLDDTDSLVVGGGTNPVLGTDSLTIRPSRSAVSDSEHIVDATHCNLLVTGAVTYQILIYGA